MVLKPLTLLFCYRLSNVFELYALFMLIDAVYGFNTTTVFRPFREFLEPKSAVGRFAMIKLLLAPTWLQATVSGLV